MNINQAYPSKYITEADLQGRPRVLTMAHVTVETMDQATGETKPILFFQGAKKGMVLNVTNKNAIVLLYGAETDNWVGKQIELYPSQTDFRGDVVPCIRCRAPGATGALGTVPEQTGAPLGAVPAQAEAQPATAAAANGGHTPTVTPPHQPGQEKTPSEELDDSIPF